MIFEYFLVFRRWRLTSVDIHTWLIASVLQSLDTVSLIDDFAFLALCYAVLHACMYVCMNVCMMYVCMYVCMNVCMMYV